MPGADTSVSSHEIPEFNRLLSQIRVTKRRSPPGNIPRNHLTADLKQDKSLKKFRASGYPDASGMKRESRENRERARRCDRGRNPHDATDRQSPGGKARRVGRSESQKTCPEPKARNLVERVPATGRVAKKGHLRTVLSTVSEVFLFWNLKNGKGTT